MPSTSPQRVVVTGLGAVTPLGQDLDNSWTRLIAGEDARAPINLFDVSGCRCQHGATAALPELDWIPSRQQRRLNRASRLALPAAVEALAMAGLVDADHRLTRSWLPLAVSTTGGGMELGEAFMRAVRGGQSARARGQFRRVARYPAQQQLLDLQQVIGFSGPITIIANACASGANAIGHAPHQFRAGVADCVLSGGYEALTELIYVGFDCLQAMSPEGCRPFDTGRSGLMMGEAAAFLVLESEQHAHDRGATILAHVAGYGHATDLHHLTQPHPAGQAQVGVMRTALSEAGLTAETIGYLNAHGTGTPLNDASECAAFQEVTGGDSRVRISSTKAAIGHTLGAAGAVEAVFAIQALRTGALPPQLNLQTPESSVAAQLVRPGEKLADQHAVMSVNLGFGGSNAALVFTAPAPATQPRIQQRRATTAAPTLAVLGAGTVTACGLGAAPLQGPQPEPVATRSYGGAEYPAYRVDLKQPALKELGLHPRLRRASPIALFMVAAAQQALDGQPAVDPARLGLVAAFGSGPLIASRRFYDGILKNGQRFAAPNLFPETVFNSATSHVAAVLGCAGPAYSIVGDRSAWVSGIAVAHRWLADQLVDQVLVIGAEELDPLILDVYRAAGWLSPAANFVAGEGAGALLLGRESSGGPLISAWSEGHTFRSTAGARAAAEASLAALTPGQAVLSTSAHNRWAKMEQAIVLHHQGELLDPPTYCGEAFTATPAWQTVQALDLVRTSAKPLAVPVWGLNEQCSALYLSPG